MTLIDRIYYTIDDTSFRTAESMAIEFKNAIGMNAHADAPVIDNICKKILLKYVYYWIFYADADEPAEILKTREIDFENKLKTIFATTYDRYFNLINYYDQCRSRLLDKIQSSTTVKFNDAPQANSIAAGDEWLTTMTNTMSESDSGDAIAKLNDIYDGYKNLYADWLHEFEPIFANNILY